MSKRKKVDREGSRAAETSDTAADPALVWRPRLTVAQKQEWVVLPGETSIVSVPANHHPPTRTEGHLLDRQRQLCHRASDPACCSVWLSPTHREMRPAIPLTVWNGLAARNRDGFDGPLIGAETLVRLTGCLKLALRRRVVGEAVHQLHDVHADSVAVTRCSLRHCLPSILESIVLQFAAGVNPFWLVMRISHNISLETAIDRGQDWITGSRKNDNIGFSVA